MCGPHGTQFLKPVELRLPHCASMTPDGWSFALKSSDTPTGKSTLALNLGNWSKLLYSNRGPTFGVGGGFSKRGTGRHHQLFCGLVGPVRVE